MADDLRVEQVVTDSTEFTEFEGDRAYCLYNKCETESKEPVAVCSGGLAYLRSLHRIYISAYFVFIDNIALVLQQNRLNWYGHVQRKDDDDWVKKCMEDQDQEEDQRGPGERLSERIIKHVK